MTKTELQIQLLQSVQKKYPPSSAEWQAVSELLHPLFRKMQKAQSMTSAQRADAEATVRAIAEYTCAS